MSSSILLLLSANNQNRHLMSGGNGAYHCLNRQRYCMCLSHFTNKRILDPACSYECSIMFVKRFARYSYHCHTERGHRGPCWPQRATARPWDLGRCSSEGSTRCSRIACHTIADNRVHTVFLACRLAACATISARVSHSFTVLL